MLEPVYIHQAFVLKRKSSEEEETMFEDSQVEWFFWFQYSRSLLFFRLVFQVQILHINILGEMMSKLINRKLPSILSYRGFYVSSTHNNIVIVIMIVINIYALLFIRWFTIEAKILKENKLPWHCFIKNKLPFTWARRAIPNFFKRKR